MGLENTLLKIDSLKREWDAAQPLKTADAERLWRKLRLEWNYNSNHIEGNTLTYGETELLIIFGQTKGDHTIREYEEMKAHDAAIEHVRALARESRLITEADIRSLNQLILKEPFWKPAITPDGQETRKQIIPGDYKTAPNNVRTATNEVFHFADPLNTPVKMQELVAWLQERLAKNDLHIAQVISKLHYDFVLIHPFDDGNGRVARLLVNYVLLRHGFPPMVIKSKDKRNYLAALNRADTGDLEAFTKYLAKEVVWALELGLRAGRGESVEEPDDLDKEIAVFAKRRATDPELVPRKSIELLTMRLQDSWLPLVDLIHEKLRPLTKVFKSAGVATRVTSFDSFPGSGSVEWNEWPTLRSRFLGPIEPQKSSGIEKFGFLTFNFEFAGYMAAESIPFDYKGGIAFHFGDSSYVIHGTPPVKFSQKRLRYDKALTDDEIAAISKPVIKAIFEDLKNTADR